LQKQQQQRVMQKLQKQQQQRVMQKLQKQQQQRVMQKLQKQQQQQVQQLLTMRQTMQQSTLMRRALTMNTKRERRMQKGRGMMIWIQMQQLVAAMTAKPLMLLPSLLQQQQACYSTRRSCQRMQMK
jgi:hypothetical protein